jgi:hypothetical protein
MTSHVGVAAVDFQHFDLGLVRLQHLVWRGGERKASASSIARTGLPAAASSSAMRWWSLDSNSGAPPSVSP